MTNLYNNYSLASPINPSEDCVWVKVLAHIRYKPTNETRIYPTEVWWHKDANEPSDFQWSENNYACDCNRVIFFNEVAKEGETVLDEDLFSCATEQFEVNLQNPVTGEFFYTEY